MANRKLIRPDQMDTRKEASGPRGARRKQVPPEQTNAEEFYYLKQMAAKTPMVLVLTNDEELRGWIEWYDKSMIKFNRSKAPNLLVPKHNIRYMYKEEEERRLRGRKPTSRNRPDDPDDPDEPDDALDDGDDRDDSEE